jgi:poly(3-hydroxybutyrate) depolymerase
MPSVCEAVGERSAAGSTGDHLFRILQDDVDIVWYSIGGMGHAWPGASSGLSDPDGPVNATNVMWDFFQAHPQTT